MSESPISLRWQSIDDLPRVLRLSAASGPLAKVFLSSDDALRLARRIEDSRPVVLVVEREVAPMMAPAFWAVLIGLGLWEALVPPALWLAGVLH